MGEAKTPGLEDTLAASAVVAKTFAQATGAAAALAVIGLFIGWRDLSSYYSALGASWMLGNLPTGRFIHQGAATLLQIAVGGVIAVSFIAQGLTTARGLLRASAGFAFVASALLLGSALPGAMLSQSTLLLLAQISSVLLAFSVGLTMGEIIAMLATSKAKFTSGMVPAASFIISMGLLWIPSETGRLRAATDLDPSGKSLASVTLVTPTARHTEWRLVALMDSSALIMALPTAPAQAVFRILPTSEIAEIRRLR